VNAVEAIKSDHRVLEGLFEEFTQYPERRAEILEEISARLEAHSKAEETEVYPHLVREGDEEEVYHGIHEHREAEDLLKKVETALRTNEDVDRTFQEFVAAVSHHVEEEENEILPALEEVTSVEKLEELGEAFENKRMELLDVQGY
jgi:hemerythrin superfamily protein